MMSELLNKSRLKEDLAWGAFIGLLFGIFLSLFAVVAYAAQGPEVFAQYNVTFRQTIVTYTVASVLGGFILGFFRPVVHQTAGGALVGFVGAFVLYGAVGIAMGGESPGEWLLVTLVCATFVGIPAGIYHARQNRKR